MADRIEMLFPWYAPNWDALDRSGAALACNMPRRRFFRSEIELMGFYQRGGQVPPAKRYYLSVDRAGDPVVVRPWDNSVIAGFYWGVGVSTRFAETWRPWQIRDGLWFWGVA